MIDRRAAVAADKETSLLAQGAVVLKPIISFQLLLHDRAELDSLCSAPKLCVVEALQGAHGHCNASCR